MALMTACSKAEDQPPKISIVPDSVFAVITDSAIVAPPQNQPVPSAPADADVSLTSPGAAPQHLLIPVAGVKWPELRDSFNDKRGERTHNALDIMAARGTPVLSVDHGTLLKLHSSVPGGLTVYAADPSRQFIYLYGHLDSFSPVLQEGQQLRRGDTIGFVGSTGNAAAAGPHLHFAVARNSDMTKWWKGTPIDPRPLMR